jgi:hypothetical protein
MKKKLFGTALQIVWYSAADFATALQSVWYSTANFKLLSQIKLNSVNCSPIIHNLCKGRTLWSRDPCSNKPNLDIRPVCCELSGRVLHVTTRWIGKRPEQKTKFSYVLYDVVPAGYVTILFINRGIVWLCLWVMDYEERQRCGRGLFRVEFVYEISLV